MFDFGPKIQALLATATSIEDAAANHECPTCREGKTDHRSEFTRSAANYRATAEDLMVKYRIAEEEALAGGEAGSVEPILHDIDVCSVRAARGHMTSHYLSTFRLIARHTGVRVWIEWITDRGYVGHVVGYEGDVRYTEFLWTAAHLMFATRIDPRWDDTLPEAENVWRLRNAGIERRVIAERAWGTGAGLVAANRSKVQRIYLRECATRGEEARATGLSHQTDVYREAYADGFYHTLARRLENARDAADSIHGGLVLHGRSDRVDEAFYGRYPHLRPTPREATPAPTTEDAKPCPKCAKAKSGRCRDHKVWVPTKADQRRWDRELHSSSARAGRASGAAAAEGVLIERGARATRVEGNGGALGS